MTLNMVTIGVDIRRHVNLPPHNFREMGVQGERSKETSYVSSLLLMSIIEFLILIQGGVQTLVFKEQTMIWKEGQEWQDRSHHPSPKSVKSEAETTCAQHLLSAKSSEGVEEMIYIISQPSVKSPEWNKECNEGQYSNFVLYHSMTEERTQVKNCKHFKTLREGWGIA